MAAPGSFPDAQLRQRVAASEFAEAVQDFEDLYIAEQRLAVLHSGESCSIPIEELMTALSLRRT